MIGENSKGKVIQGGYMHKIKLISSTPADPNDLESADNITEVSQMADVTVIQGRKALYYKEQGILKPVNIVTNWINFEPTQIEWEGKIIEVHSFTNLNQPINRRIEILGSII